ncbi:MAG: HEAT repeat domain-containing protein [Candidatus Hodarchaeota archaeon]
MTNGESLQKLIKALLEGDDPKEQVLAAHNLGKLGDRDAVDPLITALEDENLYVRKAAVEALAVLGDWKAVDPILQRLEDADLYVRQAAASALGELGEMRAEEFLQERLKIEPELIVRHAIKVALARLAGGDT